METKRRNTDVAQLIPLKLVRMISVRPDEKMRSFFDEMGPRALTKWGFAVYDDLESATAVEKDLLPDEIPTIFGGSHHIDVYACLKSLFHTEPSAWTLCEKVYNRLKQQGDLPCPSHMTFYVKRLSLSESQWYPIIQIDALVSLHYPHYLLISTGETAPARQQTSQPCQSPIIYLVDV